MTMPSRTPRRAAPFAALLAAVLAAGGLTLASDRPEAAAEWPQYRGPNRDAISPVTGILDRWPAAGPEVLWRVAVGEGYSGMAVAGGRLFTMYAQGGDELVLAHDAASGRELWRFRSDAAFRNSFGNGPRSTPTVVDGVVYALGAKGKLHALEAATGKPVWSRDLVQDLDGRIPTWGVSTTPLVEGGLVLVDVGARGKSVVAFDRRTGEVAWTAGDDIPGYATPIAFTAGGVRQAVFFTGRSVVAVTPDKGEVLWRVPWTTSYDVNAATPIFVAPDKLFVASGYDTGAALFRLRDRARRVEMVWQSRGMKNQFSSSVVQGGYLYGFDNKILKCLDVATGAEKWATRGFGHGSLVWADGHLFVLGEAGRLALVEATPEAYREKASVQALKGKCWTAPTLVDGRLFLRNEEEMVCLKVVR